MPSCKIVTSTTPDSGVATSSAAILAPACLLGRELSVGMCRHTLLGKSAEGTRDLRYADMIARCQQPIPNARHHNRNECMKSSNMLHDVQRNSISRAGKRSDLQFNIISLRLLARKWNRIHTRRLSCEILIYWPCPVTRVLK